MKLKVLKHIIIIVLCLFLTSCKNQKIALLLSSEPININNVTVLPEKPAFKAKQRIYFVLLSKNPIECPVLRLQTLKLESKYGYPIQKVDLAYAIDIERGENKNVVSDYFVLQEDGEYFIRIFSRDNFITPMVEAAFTVEKP